MTDVLETVMREAVARALDHVERGGMPFVGVLVDGDRVISSHGVNQVHATGDPTAHAEIVAIRDALRTSGRADLRGAVLLATGEPCGMCLRYALAVGVADIRAALTRDDVAALGFDYRASYPVFGITDAIRDAHVQPLRVPDATEPFTHFRTLHH